MAAFELDVITEDTELTDAEEDDELSKVDNDVLGPLESVVFINVVLYTIVDIVLKKEVETDTVDAETELDPDVTGATLEVEDDVGNKLESVVIEEIGKLELTGLFEVSVESGENEEDGKLELAGLFELPGDDMLLIDIVENTLESDEIVGRLLELRRLLEIPDDVAKLGENEIGELETEETELLEL